MGEFDRFLEATQKGDRDAKWNIFKFQDHLLEWIFSSAEYFQARDYPNSFEALTNVYTDCYGFLSDTEKTEIDQCFDDTKDAVDEYINYNITYTNIKRRVRTQTYAPPSKVYSSLLKFRKTLMMFLAKHNILMRMISKSDAGAGDA